MKKILLLTVLVSVFSSFVSALGTKNGGWQINFNDGWYSQGWCQNTDKPSGVRTWSGTNTTFSGQGGSFSASWTAADFNWIPDISKGGAGFGPIKSMVKNWNVQWDGTGNIQGNGTTYTFGLKFNTANFNGYHDYTMTDSYECYIVTSTNKTAGQLDGTWFADVYPEGDPVGYQLRKSKVNWGFGDFVQLWAFRKQNTFSGPVNVQAIVQAWSDKSVTSFKTDTWYMPGGLSIMNECFGSSGRFDLTNIQIPGFNTYLPLPHTEVVTSRGETLPNNGSAKANDGLPTTTWLDSSPTTWLQYMYTSTSKFNTYTITTGTDAMKDPKSWTIQASTNGTTWETLNTQTNQSFAARSTAYKYSFANETLYKYYKIDITANNGNANSEIAELTYSYVDAIAPITPTNVTFSNSTFTLTWTASTDNVAVTLYQIFNNGVLLGNSNTNSFVLQGATPNTTYNFTVKALDASANASPASVPVQSTTGVFSLYEAENATASGGVIATDHPGFSGTGFWGNVGTVGNSIQFNINASQAENADINCRFSSAGVKTMNLYVNDVKIRTVTFPATANWDTWSNKVDNVTLSAGANTIKYQYDTGLTGYINLDYILYSPVATSVTQLNSDQQIVVYPNPAKDVISLKNIEPNTRISICTIDGKIVYQQTATGKVSTFNVSNLERGVYLVRMQTNEKTKTQKLILQ